MTDQTNNNTRYNTGQMIKIENDPQPLLHQSSNVTTATITSSSSGNNIASPVPSSPRLITFFNNNLINARDIPSNNNNSNIKYTNRMPYTAVSTNPESSSSGDYLQNQSAVDSGGGICDYHDEDGDTDAEDHIPALIAGPRGVVTLDTDPAMYQHEFVNRASPISAAALSNNNNSHFLGRLSSKENVLFMGEELVDIGRNSSRSSVTFHVGKNSFVSRKHMQLFYYQNDFYLTCLSKNGIFIDGVFTRKTQQPLRLPKSCNFRFPSTNIRISFENLAVTENNETTNQNPPSSSSPINVSSPTSTQPTFEEQPHLMYAPTTVSITDERKSPFPSPTGTISAANSCPTSPRPIFTEYTNYSTPSVSTTTFTNDIFHPPASSSYSEHEKPPYSYAQLIVQSISASPEKQLTLSGIYSFISKNYPYYRTGANKGWQNSIRHNLSLNRYFIKVPRSQDEPGKGSFWRIDPTSEMKLIDQSYRKRRQRGTQFPFGMPRSAPVSPSHIDLLLHFVDNSTENSPLHDITMQSAPGSPGNYHTSHSDPQSIEDGSSTVQGHDNRAQEPHIYSTTYIVTPNANNTVTTTIKREYIDNTDDSQDNMSEHTEYEGLKRPKYSDN